MRVASADGVSRERLAFGAIASAPALTARAASRTSAVISTCSASPLGDEVVGLVHAAADHHAADEIRARTASGACATTTGCAGTSVTACLLDTAMRSICRCAGAGPLLVSPIPFNAG